MNRTNEERSQQLAAWLRIHAQQRDTNASRIAKRSRGGVSRAQVDWMFKGVSPVGTPMRPAHRTLEAVALGLATDGLGRVDESLRQRFLHEMMQCVGYLPDDDPKALDELAEIIAEAQEEGITVLYGRSPGLPWTQAATDDLRRRLEEYRKERKQRQRADTLAYSH